MIKKTIIPIERLWGLLKPDRKEIVNIYLFALLYGLVYLSLPLGIQAIINLIQGAQFTTSWVVLIIVVLLGVIISGILHLQQWRIAENLQQKIFTRASFEFAYRIPKIQLKELYQVYAPELMNRFFDVVSLQKGLSKLLIDFPTSSIQVVFGLILLAIYHPVFILFGFITFILAYVVYLITGTKGLNASLSESKNKYNTVHWLQEMARTNLSFKYAGTTSVPLSKTNKIADNYITSREAHFKVLVQQYISSIVFKVIIVGGFLGFGSFLVMDQKMNIGQFVAAEILVLMVVNAIEKLTLSIEVLYDILTSLEKIGNVTDLALERQSGSDVRLEKDGFEVRIQDLTFSYPFHNKPVFKDLNLKIESGSKIEIVGAEDSGKSTLIKLMMGAYELSQGQILINQLPQRQISVKSLRRNSGICMPHDLLFEGTIKENITLKRNEITEEQMLKVLDVVNLTSYIRTLPNGTNTSVVVTGERLPNDVVEKIHLARAIVHDPELVLIENKFGSIAKTELDEILNRIVNKSNRSTVVILSPYEWVLPGIDSYYELGDQTLKLI